MSIELETERSIQKELLWQTVAVLWSVIRNCKRSRAGGYVHKIADLCSSMDTFGAILVAYTVLFACILKSSKSVNKTAIVYSFDNIIFSTAPKSVYM